MTGTRCIQGFEWDLRGNGLRQERDYVVIDAPRLHGCRESIQSARRTGLLAAPESGALGSVQTASAACTSAQSVSSTQVPSRYYLNTRGTIRGSRYVGTKSNKSASWTLPVTILYPPMLPNLSARLGEKQPMGTRNFRVPDLQGTGDGPHSSKTWRGLLLLRPSPIYSS